MLVALAMNSRRIKMSISAYIDEQTKKVRERNINKGRVEGRAEGRNAERSEWNAWLDRKEEAEARGEAFDESRPHSDGQG